MNEAIVVEYLDIHAQIAVEALFSERSSQNLCDRLDRLWDLMSDVDRAAAEDKLRAKARP